MDDIEIVIGSGSGQVNITGQEFNTDISAAVAYVGLAYTITAIAAQGYVFDRFVFEYDSYDVFINGSKTEPYRFSNSDYRNPAIGDSQGGVPSTLVKIYNTNADRGTKESHRDLKKVKVYFKTGGISVADGKILRSSSGDLLRVDAGNILSAR